MSSNGSGGGSGSEKAYFRVIGILVILTIILLGFLAFAAVMNGGL